MDKEKGQKMIQSVERAVAILRCFEEQEELGVTEIGEMLGLHKSTAFGLIHTLRKEKLLWQNEATGKLRLGIELFRLSAAIKLNLKNICEPYLSELLRITRETVNLVVRDENSVVFIEKKEGPHSVRICTRVGQRLPLYCTAAGKAILAFLRESEIRGYLAQDNFEPFTEHTLRTAGELREQLTRIRAEECAYDMEELEYGLICVAAPILDRQGYAIAGVSVSGPSIRMGEEIRQSVKKLLLEKTKLIRQEI
ncbi:MAG: IclR family transcriptional regulator [Peptococcaceae bacterium]|jgi:DNA-binding IclR family transcriptional regulator|nr:IclR family transcriptional regulator [Peptococcaceae bacterium]